MARTEVHQEERRRHACGARPRVDLAAKVAQALRLLARNADRWGLTRDPAETERCGQFQLRLWRGIERLGIREEVHEGLNARHGKLPPAVRNWRRERLVGASNS